MNAMEELALRRQAEEAWVHIMANPVRAAIARVALQMIIDGKTEAEVRASIGKNVHPPMVDLAEKRRVAIEANFRKRGFNISVPKPDVSNTIFKRWRREGIELFYCPPTALVSYEAWMTAHGQGEHWTVVNEAERAKVAWENTAEGYWFTTQIAPACPRLKTSWNAFTASTTRLLSIEEYVIVFWVHRDLTSVHIDFGTLCWLRTRFGSSALFANSVDGWVDVNRSVVAGLAISQSYAGGRAVEVVANAA